MMKTKRDVTMAMAGLLAGWLLAGCGMDPVTRGNAASTSASELASNSRAALNSLYSKHPKARELGSRAKGVLVFPKITKGGLMIGGQGGNGTLFVGGRAQRFYQSLAVSYGLQAGVQQFGYALFLMDDNALSQLDAADGWEIGSSPSVVVVDQGMAGSFSTTSMRKGTYAVFFDQKGLMAGLGLQGTKITRIQPGN